MSSEVLARERDVVSEDAYRYFQDVGDHLSRVQDSIETYQDVAASVMDIYLSAQNNRMNEIMKQLTVVATIFMPLDAPIGYLRNERHCRACGLRPDRVVVVPRPSWASWWSSRA